MTINMRRFALWLALLCIGGSRGVAQTTQSLISGHVIDSRTGRAIAGVTVTVAGGSGTETAGSRSDETGRFYLPLLSPGVYSVRVTVDRYQAQEIQRLELTVASRLELEIRLRPLSDVWESGQYGSVVLPEKRIVLNFFGPDLDSTRTASFESQNGRLAPLESSLSDVYDSDMLRALPLQSRDVYTMLVTEPGVTSDAATGRGLGLSIDGQRPTASNFLLDGLENNNYLTTGPLTPVAPEAIQEYRVSTSNYSAEYGRTSGYLANAITKIGSNAFHGVAYTYLKNEALDANSFQENLIGGPRAIDKQVQPGYFLGGPVLKNELLFSSAFEYLRSRGEGGSSTFLVPGPTFQQNLPPVSTIGQLLAKYPAPATAGNQPLESITVAPPVSVDRSLALERLDYVSKDGKNRVQARGIVAAKNQPDFIWTPYKDFTTPLAEDNWAAGGSYIRTFRPSLIDEFRASYSYDNLHFNRAHPEIPTLVGEEFSPNEQIVLPGSPAFYSYKNRSGSTEFVDNLIWSKSRHQITVGGGTLLRNIDGYLTAGRDGAYFFGSQGVTSGFVALLEDSPSLVSLALDRLSLPGERVQPDYDRSYRYAQFDAFAQDTWKASRRLTVNYGIRYEVFGAPMNNGAVNDALVVPGTGATLASQLPGATLSLGSRQLFRTDKSDFAYRVGVAYDLFGNGRTLLRGGSGIFYDRPFDNLWEGVANNNLVVPLVPLSGRVNYLAPIATVAASLPTARLTGNFPDLTWIDPGLRNGRVYNYFGGIQHRAAGLIFEVNAQGSYGRNLIATDVINRDQSTPSGRFNANLPDINYRGSQGYSNYNALTALMRYRTPRGMVQASYSWSHLIDNQSDALAGDFFDLSFTGVPNASSAANQASFSRQFDPNSDRGNSDFDQRQNLVLFSFWALPGFGGRSGWNALFRHWTVAGLAAFRGGLPYTVIQNSVTDPQTGLIFNPRPNIAGNTALSPAIPVAGGEMLLNAAAFAPVQSGLGNEGRNALRGPGLYNVDLSLGREFPIPRLGESTRITLRADAFNVLNHANLNNPDPRLVDNRDFGIASFGRTGYGSGFPAVSPLNETPRQIQMLLRVEF